MRLWWGLGLSLCLAGCASTHYERRMAYLEGRVSALQELLDRQVEREGRLHSEIDELRAQRSATATDRDREVPTDEPRTGLPAGSLAEYKTLYQETGRLLNAVYQQRGDLDALVRDFLSVNYHDGALHPAARERYVNRLLSIRSQAEHMAAQCQPDRDEASVPADRDAPDSVSGPGADSSADSSAPSN